MKQHHKTTIKSIAVHRGNNIKRVLNMQKSHRVVFNEHYGFIDYCQKCGNNIGLQIHHIDKNHKNNIPINLIKLCHICHLEAHIGDNMYKLMKKRFIFQYGNT